MPTPFKTKAHPIFLTYGRSNERYCLQSGLEVRYEQMIHDHLRRQGFERIVFFGNRGCYMLDQESVDLFHLKDVKEKKQEASVPSGIKPGPGGFVKRKNTSSNKPSSRQNRYVYKDHAKPTWMVPYIDRLMREEEIRTAVIIADTNIFSLDANSPDTSKFRSLLQHDLPSLSTTNRNIIIINHPSANPAEALNRFGWKFLFPEAETNAPGIATPVCLGPPEQDEIKNYLISAWLQKGIQVNWHDFKRCVTILTAHIKSSENGATLSSLSGFRKGELDITLESVRELTGERSTPPAKEQLESLIGLKNVKEYIRGKLKGIDNLRKSTSGQPEQNSTEQSDIQRLSPAPVPPWKKKQELHLALTGNAGTGKTTIARLFGELYRDAGILELGHVVKVTRDDLVAGFVGQSALKTRAAIRRALGGVLFIDEAYSIFKKGNDQDFGSEVVATLVEAMSDLQGTFMVVIAGYQSDIEKFIRSNDGLPRRFGSPLHIEDYTPEELEQLLRTFLKELDAPPLSNELDSGLGRLCANFYGERSPQSGNAGAIRRLAITLVENHGHLSCLLPEYIPNEMKHYFSHESTEKEGTLKDLEQMVGLENVKQTVTTLFYTIRSERILRGDSKAKVMPGHFLFKGNPGTGKTEVAKMMARQFHALELVQSRELVATRASDLATGYQDQTKTKTREFLESGLGKVIFIDEAHQLYPRGEEHRLSSEAIKALVPFLEDHNQDCIVILAGYPEEIDYMLNNADPGLKGRFANDILFNNYTPQELVAIFDSMVEKVHLIWPKEEMTGYLQEYFLAVQRSQGRTFSNARFVRDHLLGTCRANKANRLKESENPEEHRRLQPEDFPEIPMT